MVLNQGQTKGDPTFTEINMDIALLCHSELLTYIIEQSNVSKDISINHLPHQCSFNNPKDKDSLPIPTQQNFRPDQIESICRRQIKCNKNDNF